MTLPNEVTVFVRDVSERGVKTAAQGAILEIVAQGGADALHTSAFSLNWMAILGFALGGFVLSVLTSLASQPVGDGLTASLLKTPTLSLPAAAPVANVASVVADVLAGSAAVVAPRVVAPAETAPAPAAPAPAAPAPAPAAVAAPAAIPLTSVASYDANGNLV